jgi:hypothetical protein
MIRRSLFALALSSFVLLQAACQTTSRHSRLPKALTDAEFWTLTTQFSEPSGEFTHSDNLVSNEPHFVHTVRTLGSMGGVYIGVGPEQNFSYVARLRPEMAFIVDIRQANRNLHLMYKALFVLSADRADFLSRLFSRARPAGLTSGSSVQDLFAKYETMKPDRSLHESAARLIREWLIDTHRFPLSAEDLESIDYAFNAFYSDGPNIQYARSRPNDAPAPSYRTLMTSTDVNGLPRSYLATEDAFAFVKSLQMANMIVPVVGDFAGPTALRGVADYIRQHDATIDAFYGSNVEVYLTRMKRAAFCGNLATMPYTWRTWFIGSKGMQPLGSKLKSCLHAAP